MTKACSSCLSDKPLDQFEIRRDSRDGRRGVCIDCARARRAAYFQRNKASVLEKQRERLAKQDREARLAYHAAYYQKNKAALNARQREREQQNRDVVAAKRAADHARNRDRDNANSAKWRKDNPERRAHLSRVERARKANAAGRHTPEDVQKLYVLQKARCPVCRTGLADGFHVDHIVPLSKGGSDDKLNLQLLCPPCNLSKHNKLPSDFMQSRGFLC